MYITYIWFYNNIKFYMFHKLKFFLKLAWCLNSVFFPKNKENNANII